MEKNDFSEIIYNCPLLFNKNGDSLFCGFECSTGWKEPLSNICYKFEVLNMMYYPKYRIRIQAEQIKEKFGTLRFYYSIVIDNNAIVCFIYKIILKIIKYFENTKRFNYNMVKIIDKAAYVEKQEKELSKAEYLNALEEYSNISNVNAVKKDGKFFLISEYSHYENFHYEPSRLKIIYKFKQFLIRFSNLFQHRNYYDLSKKQTVIRNYLENLAFKETANAENECMNYCETCGSQIGTSWNPRCETTGYIQYLCKKCANKTNNEYLVNGELWQANKKIKTAKEVKKENAAVEKQLKILHQPNKKSKKNIKIAKKDSESLRIKI